MADDQPEDFAFQHLCGWRGVDDLQRSLAAGTRTFSQAAGHLMTAASPTDPVLLYKAWRDVLGKDPAYVGQAIGDCVSFGHAHANDLLQCIEAAAGDKSILFQETDTEFIYGESRKVAGILGRQDGSYGGAAVKAMTTVGMVSRAMLGSDGSYSGQRAKSWGLQGPPSAIEAKASAFKLGAYAQVTTWDELVAAIQNGYPTSICTASGFSMTRDQQGFCRQQGRWGHCMFIAGLRFDRPGALVVQSWGPDTPSGPLALDQPTFSFWSDQQAIVRILGEGDSWAISKTPAFVKRDVPAAWKYSDAA